MALGLYLGSVWVVLTAVLSASSLEIVLQHRYGGAPLQVGSVRYESAGGSSLR